MTQQTQIGQRVRLHSTAYTVAQGSIGTIVSIDQPFQGLYAVQFDAQSRTHLIYGIHLELIKDKQQVPGHFLETYQDTPQKAPEQPRNTPIEQTSQ